MNIIENKPTKFERPSPLFPIALFVLVVFMTIKIIHRVNELPPAKDSGDTAHVANTVLVGNAGNFTTAVVGGGGGGGSGGVYTLMREQDMCEAIRHREPGLFETSTIIKERCYVPTIKASTPTIHPTPALRVR